MTAQETLRLTPYEAHHFLKTEAEMAAYLDETLKLNHGDPKAFMDALSQVAKARGMTELARNSGIQRETLYRSLTSGVFPRIDTLTRIVDALGLSLSISVKAK